MPLVTFVVTVAVATMIATSNKILRETNAITGIIKSPPFYNFSRFVSREAIENLPALAGNADTLLPLSDNFIPEITK